MIDRDDPAIGITDHAARKGGFNIRGEQREAVGGVAGTVAEVFGDEAGVLEERQAPVEAEFPVALAFLQQVGIAAGNDRGKHGFPAREIENRDVLRDRGWPAQRGKAGGLVCRDVAGL
ncbi:MAG: hypothetical protein B7X78_03030 [Sphingomonadales bacterium 39-62-4]|nr:MAG: hypothetical protein B7X78_03030 [Sphingomonadales bacterium 39-62-4]